MPQEQQEQQEQQYDEVAIGEGQFKIHVSRIPLSFDEASVKRILEEKLKENTAGNQEEELVTGVTLIYKRPDIEEEYSGNDKEESQDKKNKKTPESTEQQHRGFGFVTLSDEATYQKALALKTVRGGRKPKSSKKHTMYIRPYADKKEDEEGENQERRLCFLWANHRCPYGEDCKFLHQGPGSCLVKEETSSKNKNKKKNKCFEFHKKGKCRRGDQCPFSHDIDSPKEVSKEAATNVKQPRPDSEKDCINWKTKGKCHKGNECPYKHDPAVKQAALDKKKKKRKMQEQDNDNNNKRSRKDKQPLWVRVFGLNYETREVDVREFLENCGPIVKIEFPRFNDSGRSKGYCGVLFQSPKAVEQALELDGAELHGRWLRIQAGKMLLDQWESTAATKDGDDADADGVET